MRGYRRWRTNRSPEFLDRIEHERLIENGCALGCLDGVQTREAEIVRSKLADGSWSTEVVPCPACSGLRFEQVGRRDRYGFDYSLCVCAHCGLLQVNPRLVDAAYGDFYATHYRLLYNGRRTADPRVLHAPRQRGRDALNFLASHDIPAGADVVEIGCGTGGQLLPFRDAGFRTIGYDFDPSFLAFGRDTHGLDLRDGGLGALEADVERGDVRPQAILYIHVFEHLVDIPGELRRLEKLLRDSGVLFLEVPGLDVAFQEWNTFVDSYVNLAHVYHFDRATLRTTMEANGWSVRAVDDHVRGVFTPGAAARRAPQIGSERTRARLASLEAAQTALEQATRTVPDADVLFDVLVAAPMRHSQAAFLTGHALAYHDLDSIDWFLRAAELEPDNGHFTAAAADALAAAGRLAEALPLYRSAALRWPGNSAVHFGLGNAHMAVGAWQQAATAYEAAIALHPASSAYAYQAGIAYCRLEEWELALRRLRECLSINPSNAYAEHQIGIACERLGRFGDAVAAHRRAYEISPKEHFLVAADRAQRLLGASG